MYLLIHDPVSIGRYIYFMSHITVQTFKRLAIWQV